jgi:archaemetzincin
MRWRPYASDEIPWARWDVERSLARLLRSITVIPSQRNPTPDTEHQAPMGLPRIWMLLAFIGLVVSGLVLACPLVRAPSSESTAPKTPAQSIGPVDDLSLRTQRAFEATDAFPPLPKPGPGDWLAINDEELQTPADYLASEPNLPVAPRNVLYVLPVGPMPAELGPTVDELTSYAHAFFGLEVRVLPTLDPEALDVTRRMHHGGPQLNATDILDRMEPQLPDDAYCMIAVTWSDVYPDDTYNFVFGLARLTARVGVFSFARLHPDFYGAYPGDDAEIRELVTRRALAVMSHEIGHMFGIPHCVSFACNMNGSNSLEESDRQPMHLCPVCLRKLHLALGFDPEARYEALEEQFRRAGLRQEAAWVQRQRAYIAEGAASSR